MTKNKGGRPTKYKPEYCQKVDEYLATCGTEQMKLPTKEEFALNIGVDDKTLDNWAKKNKEFFRAIKKIELTQKVQLISNGIFGGKEINASMCIFLLKTNHDMIESERIFLNLGDRLDQIEERLAEIKHEKNTSKN